MNHKFFENMVFTNSNIFGINSHIFNMDENVKEFGTIYGVQMINNPNLQDNECYIYDEKAMSTIEIPIRQKQNFDYLFKTVVLTKPEFFVILRVIK